MLCLELMTTEGCHLCDHAIAILQSVLRPDEVEVDLVDIAYDDQLMAQYATRIPVLRAAASGSELDWPFDESQLRSYLAGCLADSRVESRAD